MDLDPEGIESWAGRNNKLVVTSASLLVTKKLLGAKGIASRNKCIASSNKCIASSNKCLTLEVDGTSALGPRGRGPMTCLRSVFPKAKQVVFTPLPC